MPDGLRLALTTLTVAPMRGPRTLDRRTAGSAMGLAPLVGALLAVVAAALLLGARELKPGLAPPLLACTLAIGSLALLTRGLHLDGLCDTVDGLASYRPAPEALSVMRRPDVGPLGMVAAVLCLAVQVSALLSAVVDGRGTVSLLLAVTTGRLAVTAACTRATPAASASGLGAMVAGTVPRQVPVVWVGILGVVSAAYGALDGGGQRGVMVVDAVRPLVALGLALLATRSLRRHAVRRLGGITGDVLGALVEVGTTVALVVMALDVPLTVQQHFHLLQPV